MPRVYTAEQKIAKAAYMEQYRLDHLDAFKARDRARYERIYATPAGRARYHAQSTRWFHENTDKALAANRARRADNPDKFLKYDKQYRKKNIERIRAYNRTWTVNRRATNLNALLKHRLRQRLRHALLLSSAPKRCSILALVGCSFTDLKRHIARQFTKGMSWTRIREIDIDHKRPCCAFDLTKPSQQRACFHFSNLQPLWATDNRRKHTKIL
jgi:hypothetical protein